MHCRCRTEIRHPMAFLNFIKKFISSWITKLSSSPHNSVGFMFQPSLGRTFRKVISKIMNASDTTGQSIMGSEFRLIWSQKYHHLLLSKYYLVFSKIKPDVDRCYLCRAHAFIVKKAFSKSQRYHVSHNRSCQAVENLQHQ